ncbi:enoyl-CoA hydratase/isomerase family protein [Nocardia sp. BMG51109]|uniref:enoyl-CoA hydratase/isomerase family protein n=1 Tax=Nocardia sp. BMG51109 TaxID=1056816 RepID=UPI0004B94FD5|nr:enoyl-CoA hydratase/isomerase family protein [Nocardia sp. BMG51109]
MPFDSISYRVDGHTATITLNRPDALNALSPHMITELRAAYTEAENDDKVWTLVVTGTGRAFCTGADVKAILEGLDLPLHEADMLAESFRERVTRTEDALEGPRAFVEKRTPQWQCR